MFTDVSDIKRGIGQYNTHKVSVYRRLYVCTKHNFVLSSEVVILLGTWIVKQVAEAHE